VDATDCLSDSCGRNSRGYGSNSGKGLLAVDLGLGTVAGDVSFLMLVDGEICRVSKLTCLAAAVTRLAGSIETIRTSRCCSTVTADVAELSAGVTFDRVSQMSR
jgi:hypothetical protein